MSSFGPLTINTVDYVPRSQGVYQKSSLGFGDPTNEFRVRPAVKPGKDGSLRGSVSKILEKDVDLPSGGTRRDQLIVTVNITTTTSFTAAEIDAQVSDIAELITVARVNTILSGGN